MIRLSISFGVYCTDTRVGLQTVFMVVKNCIESKRQSAVCALDLQLSIYGSVSVPGACTAV